MFYSEPKGKSDQAQLISSVLFFFESESQLGILNSQSFVAPSFLFCLQAAGAHVAISDGSISKSGWGLVKCAF